MDYKAHTKYRFKQKFFKDLSDADYYAICEICRNKINYIEVASYKGATKMVISYNDNLMWCVLSKRRKIVKTVYPVSKEILNSLINSPE